MMTVAEEKQGVADPGRRARTVPATGLASGQKRLEAGSLFMPNVSEKKLVRMCAKEKNVLAKLRMLACIVGAKTIRSPSVNNSENYRTS